MEDSHVISGLALTATLHSFLQVKYVKAKSFLSSKDALKFWVIFVYVKMQIASIVIKTESRDFMHHFNENAYLRKNNICNFIG